MLGHTAASTVSISSAGMLRIWKMPACLASIRNSTLSFSASLAVTVTVTVTSNTPSSSDAALVCSCRSICGFSRSRKIAGALGISSERSFTYSFSMLKIGCVFVCAASVMASSLMMVQQHCIQFTRAIQRSHIVIAADVFAVDVDLRHGATAGLPDHLVAQFRLQIDADLLDVLYTLALQQLLGTHAVRAHLRAVHDDLSHHFSRGRLAFCQAMMPPCRL